MQHQLLIHPPDQITGVAVVHHQGHGQVRICDGKIHLPDAVCRIGLQHIGTGRQLQGKWGKRLCQYHAVRIHDANRHILQDVALGIHHLDGHRIGQICAAFCLHHQGDGQVRLLHGEFLAVAHTICHHLCHIVTGGQQHGAGGRRTEDGLPLGIGDSDCQTLDGIPLGVLHQKGEGVLLRVVRSILFIGGVLLIRSFRVVRGVLLIGSFRVVRGVLLIGSFRVVGCDAFQRLLQNDKQGGCLCPGGLPLGMEAAVRIAPKQPRRAHQLHGGPGIVTDAVRIGEALCRILCLRQDNPRLGEVAIKKGRHLLPGHRVIDAKAPVRVSGGNTLCLGPGHIGGIPAARLHIGEGALCGAVHLCPGKSPQNGHKHGAGQGCLRLEGIAAGTVHQPGFAGGLHIGGIPAAVGNICKAAGSGHHRQQLQQKGNHQQKTKGTLFHSRFLPKDFFPLSYRKGRKISSPRHKATELYRKSDTALPGWERAT